MCTAKPISLQAFNNTSINILKKNIEYFSYHILTGKPTGKRPLGRPWRRWENNIRMDLEWIGINAGNWVDSSQDRDYWITLLNAALNLRVTGVMELVS